MKKFIVPTLLALFVAGLSQSQAKAGVNIDIHLPFPPVPHVVVRPPVVVARPPIVVVPARRDDCDPRYVRECDRRDYRRDDHRHYAPPPRYYHHGRR